MVDYTSQVSRGENVKPHEMQSGDGLLQKAINKREFVGDEKVDVEFYRSLLEMQNEYIVVWDINGIIQYCNQSFAHLFNQQPDHITGHSIETLVFREDLPDLRRQVEQIYRLDKGQPVISMEHRVRNIHGVFLWQEWTHQALFNQDDSSGFLSVGRDVSRRHLTENAFSAAETSFGMLFKNSLDAIFLLSETGKIIACNFSASRMFGWTEDELSAIDWKTIVDFNDNQSQTALLGWRLSEYYQGELTMVRRGGEKFPVEISCVAYRENSVEKRISLVVRDISDRRKTEEKLKQVYDRLSYHINNSPLAVIEWDENSRLQLWSKGAERIFGWSADEVIGKLWHQWSFTFEDDRDMVQLMADKLRNGSSNYNIIVNRNYTRDGRVLTCRWHNTAMIDKNGESVSVLSLVQNITEQAETEKALLESEERYRSLFQNNHSVMLLLDSETGDILDANAAACSFYGYSKEQFIGMNIANINSVDSIDVYEELLRAERLDNKNFVFRHRLYDGNEKDVEIFSGPIHIGGKHLLYAIIHDITERVRVEEALHQQMYENARLLSQASRQAQDRQDILHLSSLLRVAEKCSEVYPIMTEAVTAMLRAQAGALALLENKKLKFVSGCGKWNSIVDIQHAIHDDKIWNVIRTGNIEYYDSIDDLKQKHIQSSFHLAIDDIETMAMIPVQVGNTIIGLFVMGYVTVEDFSLAHEPLAKEISEIAGITLHRLQVVESLERLVVDRTKELDTLFNVTSVARKTLNLKTSMEGALDQIQKVMDNLAGAIYLINENSLDLELVIQQGVPKRILDLFAQIRPEQHPNVWVLKNGETLFLPDIAANPNFPIPEDLLDLYAFLSVPLRVGGQVVGVLNVFRDIEKAFNIEEMTLISAIADHLGLIVENMRLHKQAEQAAIMEERARLARDLHDSATQYLYSITLYTEAGKTLFDKGNYQQVQHYINRLAEISHQALKEIRLLVYELRPPALDEDGIIGALKKRLDAVEERARVHATLVSEKIVMLPRSYEEGLYKIALEALNNALKYAEASEVKVHIRQQNELVVLTVADNGKGFDVDMASQKGGMGLTNMRERAEKMGGSLDIKSHHETGTIISALIPISDIANHQEKNGEEIHG